MSEPDNVGTVDYGERMHTVRIIAVGGGMGLVFGYGLGGPIGALILGVLIAGVGLAIKKIMVDGTGSAVSSMLLPNSRGGTGVGYSHIEALEIQGDIPGALAAWEEVIAGNPGAISAHVNGADLYARKSNDYKRAAELFCAARKIANVPEEVARYTSQRLIDLYLGPLNDEGRALVELRRVAERWPGTPEGEGARRAIANIKKL